MGVALYVKISVLASGSSVIVPLGFFLWMTLQTGRVVTAFLCIFMKEALNYNSEQRGCQAMSSRSSAVFYFASRAAKSVYERVRNDRFRMRLR